MTNIELRRIIAALAAILKDYTSHKKAINAVDEYIEKTMDTGEMDDFLESPEGQMYVKYSK